MIWNPKKKPCAYCGEKFKPSKPLQAVCSPRCAIEFNKPKNIKSRVKEMRAESKSLSELRATARDYFQQWIRLRDSKMPCISCGKAEAKQWDGSHYYKAEVFTGLIFDEDNCHRACSYCNCHLDGNLIEYRKGLLKRIGADRVAELEARANLSRVYKFSKEELISIAEKYRELIKQLKKAA